jgi:hypothetical protein
MALTRTYVGKSVKKAATKIIANDTTVNSKATHVSAGKKAGMITHVIGEKNKGPVTVVVRKHCATTVHPVVDQRKSLGVADMFKMGIIQEGRGEELKLRIDRALKDSDEARARMRRPGKVKVIG